FDHYYGMLRGVRGFADPNAHTLSTGNSVFYQPNDTNPLGYTLPFQLSAANGLCVPDMAHSWTSMHQSWNDGKLDDFLGAEGKTSGAHTMGYYTRAELRFHYELADAYTICDHYFGSVLGPTNPNRLYSMTGTIDPEGKAGGPVTDNSEAGYSWTTYPERLQAAGITWRNYQNTSDNYDDNALAWFTQYRQAPQSSPLYQHGMSSVTINGTHEDQFIRDVATDSLPQVSWIIPSARYSEHPGESYSIAAGEDLARKYLEAIAANPTVYNKTVFIYTFDESGGFFDHVPPPIAPLGTPGEYINDTPIGLGFRVPTIIVSPWTRGGYVCSDVFDHTSLLRFLEARFGVEEPNISAWRRATCGDLTSAFDFTAPDASFPTLPDTTELAAQACTAYTPHPPVEQTMPVQETGTRPRRGGSA
ncbi:MAG: phospholipase C, phosphocholine-specific, partial [Anaerolineae bacterium]|nr:phospholipase C, phosphocholine-specific [Anaerolineae bacterium]